MALVTEISRKIDNNYVQVKVSADNIMPRYYKVPESEADSFQAEYKSEAKRVIWANTGLALLGVFSGMIPAFFITKRMEPKAFLKSVINVGGGFIGGLAGIAMGNKIGKDSHKDMLKKYNAELMEPQMQGLPI